MGAPVSRQPSVVVIGGANMDIKARSTRRVVPATSNPGQTSLSPGGVGRNVAENLARLGRSTSLVAAVGQDALGDQLVSATAAAGVDVAHVVRSPHPTGTYTAVLDADGELVVGVADMAATDGLRPEHVAAAGDAIAAAGLVVVDGNLATETLSSALELAAAHGVPVVLEPVSVPKATASRTLLSPSRPILALTPNRDELAALTGLPASTEGEVRAAVASLHDRGVTLVWVRLGGAGSLLSGPEGEQSFPPVATVVVDVTGAGDAMLAAFADALLSGADPATAVTRGHAAAAVTIASPHTVCPEISPALLNAQLRSAPS